MIVYRLSDIAGNVWEWTATFLPRTTPTSLITCAAPLESARPLTWTQLRARGPGEHIPRRVNEAGSHLCAAATAFATAPPPVRAKLSTPPRATSELAASSPAIPSAESDRRDCLDPSAVFGHRRLLKYRKQDGARHAGGNHFVDVGTLMIRTAEREGLVQDVVRYRLHC